MRPNPARIARARTRVLVNRCGCRAGSSRAAVRRPLGAWTRRARAAHPGSSRPPRRQARAERSLAASSTPRAMSILMISDVPS